MRYALDAGRDVTHGCQTTMKPPVLTQHNADADAVADIASPLRDSVLPKSHTLPEGTVGNDAIVFDDSGV